MKAVRSFRGVDDFDPDDRRRGTKLPPVKKSGKERYQIYNDLDDEDEDEILVKRESVFDYFDDDEDD